MNDMKIILEKYTYDHYSGFHDLYFRFYNSENKTEFHVRANIDDYLNLYEKGLLSGVLDYGIFMSKIFNKQFE